MRQNVSTPSRFRTLLASAALLVAVGCHDSNTVSGPPVTSANVAGTWTGTWQATSYECDPSVRLAAQATFAQSGSTVTGKLTASGGCGLNFSFTGMLDAGSLTGNLGEAGFASGQVSASGKALNLVIRNHYMYKMGDLHLTR